MHANPVFSPQIVLKAHDAADRIVSESLVLECVAIATYVVGQLFVRVTAHHSPGLPRARQRFALLPTHSLPVTHDCSHHNHSSLYLRIYIVQIHVPFLPLITLSERSLKSNSVLHGGQCIPHHWYHETIESVPGGLSRLRIFVHRMDMAIPRGHVAPSGPSHVF